jgi:hypothetical protein
MIIITEIAKIAALVLVGRDALLPLTGEGFDVDWVNE